MSKMADAMIDFCELSVQGEHSFWNRSGAEIFDDMMLAISTEYEESEAFKDFLKTKRTVARIKAATGERRLRWATKLWNTIDCMDRPEALFALLVRELPDCFYEQSPNGLKFTY